MITTILLYFDFETFLKVSFIFIFYFIKDKLLTILDIKNWHTRLFQSYK